MPAERQMPKPIRVAVVSDTELAAGRIAQAVREADVALRPFPLVLQSAYDRIRDLSPQVALIRTGPRGFQLAASFGKAAGGHACGVVLLTPASFPRETDWVVETGAFIHLLEPVPAQVERQLGQAFAPRHGRRGQPGWGDVERHVPPVVAARR